ncbi:MAG: cobyrinate a,c-diamide synthase, partial [Chloroflexi bacterium]|nr:cobyrinate a,c-diamide synthase [Chloroflexota bacterium]
WTAGPIERTTGLPVLGYLPKRADLELPERHMGLIPTAEGTVRDDFFERLARQAEQTIDLDRLLALARTAALLLTEQTGLFPAAPVEPRARIALVWDEAFNFYYQDNLNLLRAWGAELVSFSPLHDEQLPPDIGGIYIGGGFPELYARELAANRSMQEAFRRAAAAGLPIYAECGGLMYLSGGIVNFEGAEYPMVRIVPGWSVLDQPRLSLGYRVATARRTTFLLEAGERIRGHEFHWSQLRGGAPAEQAAYELDSQERRLEGYAAGSVLASYLHVHFGSNPRLAPRLVAACCRDIAPRGRDPSMFGPSPSGS